MGAAHGEEREVRVGERERTRGARARWLSEVRDGERERGRERESGGRREGRGGKRVAERERDERDVSSGDEKK